MDSSGFSMNPSPRREIQGPRPAPLKVSKGSYKIKKPPMAPPPAAQLPLPQQQYRPPVIIYTVSPKVIHTKPSEFMALVQRLTGASTSSSSSAAAGSGHSLVSPSAGALSPAARLAVIETSAATAGGGKAQAEVGGDGPDIIDRLGISGGPAAAWERPAGNFPGILSPVPSSLPNISPNFFSPSVADSATLAFFNDMSPIFRGSSNNNNNNNNNSNKSFMENFLVSPTNFFSTTPTMPSPGALWDIFNQL